MDLPSLDDIRVPIEIEETKKKGGWDFGDMKPDPVIPPEDWPIYGPPTPSFFEGMLDGVDDDAPLIEGGPGDLGPIYPREPNDLGPLDPPRGGCVVEPEPTPLELAEEHVTSGADAMFDYLRDLY